MMVLPCLLLGLVLAADATDEPAGLPPAATRTIDYQKDIRPIFAASCYRCHGPKRQRGGLGLHQKASALAGGDSGPVIVPGRSAESRLIRYVAGLDEDHVMPPEGAGEPLNPEQIGLLRAWIDQGAPWPEEAVMAAGAQSDHWAFRKPVRPELPEVKDRSWARNPIDRFVLARLEKEGLKPSPEADRATLIRRLSLDLIGLPPSIAEVDAFQADDRPDAYERLVDRLLASPHFGERWGRHWLDAARYADTNGYEKDRARSIWPYRDWVIRALNADMPFDRFTIEQIAGDMLPGASTDQKIATGFHRNTMINEEGGIDVEEFRYASIVDRVATTGTVWLGLTLGCAQCHSHKYDPITQREYYQFFAFFNNADEPDLVVPDPAIAARRAAVEAQIAALEAKREEQFPTGEAVPFVPVEEQRLAHLAEQMAAWERSLKPVRWTPLTPSRLVSKKGATMTVLEDRSVLVSGDKPNNDVYEVELPTDLAGISALRLEVLPHESLPDGGPGRAPLFSVGDFLLTEVELAAGPKEDPQALRPVTIAGASHDYAERGRSAAQAIDGKTDTGWAVKGGIGRPHAAVFE
ncbi:MAG: DUF1549 domain-containing protein, partial [Isosphaeraceae bacterium]|nr:DUF1549 domain-containing protein [Isosphaeraceae bacterium]